MTDTFLVTGLSCAHQAVLMLSSCARAILKKGSVGLLPTSPLLLPVVVVLVANPSHQAGGLNVVTAANVRQNRVMHRWRQERRAPYLFRLRLASVWSLFVLVGGHSVSLYRRPGLVQPSRTASQSPAPRPSPVAVALSGAAALGAVVSRVLG